jgi:hypothetical protein
MKKFNFVYVVMIALAIAAFLTISPIKSANQKTMTLSTNSIPDDVSKILKKSCTGCHDEGGNGMAMTMWNYSAWDTYPAKKQAKKSSAMCDAMTNASMPPSEIRKSYPDRVPTAAQIQIVCKWANSLEIK